MAKKKGQKAGNKKQKQNYEQRGKKSRRKKFIFLLLILIFSVIIIDVLIATKSIKRTSDNETIAGLKSGCEAFKDDVLWTSRYSALEKGSTNYQTWNLNHNCSELEGLGEEAESCVIKSMNVKARFNTIISEDLTAPANGYVQISSPDESICNNPESGQYSKYLAYETIEGEGMIMMNYCGKDKKGAECDKITDNYGYSNCYGIKAYGSQYMIVDVLEVNYILCKIVSV